MERLRKLIKEVLSNPPKNKKCNCGCNSCKNEGNSGVILNENKVPKQILSENLKYHVDNRLPLSENTFRYGSEAFLNLWAEARALYLRKVIHVNDKDKEILLETDLGNYGVYEGKKVPLDLPMVNNLNEATIKAIHNMLFKNKGFKDIVKNERAATIRKAIEAEGINTEGVSNDELIQIAKDLMDRNTLNEAEYQGRKVKLNKPKRGGSKAYYVYVNSGKKTKDGKIKAKKVSFGSGMRAKLSDPDARKAYSKRHNCDEKKDRTTAGYWSCRLTKFAKDLGFDKNYPGYW